MTTGKISRRIIVDRLAQLDHLLKQVRAFPLDDRDAFFADPCNVLAAESCLRRGLEILLDLGRHILAKGFAVGVTEYKEIADEELYELCSKKLGDLDQISGAYRYWVEGHPEKLDEAL